MFLNQERKKKNLADDNAIYSRFAYNEETWFRSLSIIFFLLVLS